MARKFSGSAANECHEKLYRPKTQLKKDINTEIMTEIIQEEYENFNKNMNEIIDYLKTIEEYETAEEIQKILGEANEKVRGD